MLPPTAPIAGAVAAAWLVAGVGVARQQAPAPAPAAGTPRRDELHAAGDDAVAPSPFHPVLETAIAALVAEQVRLNRLTLRSGDGDHDALQQLYVEALDRLPRSIVEEFDATHGIAVRTVYEMLVTWRAHALFGEAMAAARNRGRPLQPDDLLAIVAAPDLATLPVGRVPADTLAFLAELRDRAGAEVDVHLWYPSIGWLAFAALHTAEFWSAEPGEAADRALARRTAFIQDLLELVAVADPSPLLTQIVDVALAPPLDLATAPSRPGDPAPAGVTCCRAEFARHRGRVGFTASHLEFVSRFGLDAETGRVDGVEIAPTMAPPGDRIGFMAMMRLRILVELDPDALVGPAASRFGTTAEVEAWYRAMFAERGWRNFWEEARHDVEHLIAGDFPDLRDPRLETLQRRAADPSLPDDVRAAAAAEAQALAFTRMRDHERLAGVLLQLLASSADVSFAKDELLRLHPRSPFGDWDATLAPAWLSLVQRDPGWVDELLAEARRGFDGEGGSGLTTMPPKPALEAALLEVRRRLREGTSTDNDVETLLAFGLDGPAATRACAYFDQALLPSAAARRLAEGTIARLERNDTEGTPPLRSLVELLFERRGEPWSLAALRRTFDLDGRSLWQGRWLGAPPDLGDGPAAAVQRDAALRAWVAAALDDETGHALERRGLVPKEILEARSRTPAGH